MSLKTPWLLPILSGIFIGTSYIPFPPWASLFGFIPLWIFWEQQQKLRHVLLSGFLCAAVFTLIGFNWVTYLLHEFAFLPWFAAGIGMIFFAVLAHLFVPIAGALWFWGYKRKLYTGWQSILMMGLLTALCLWAVPMLFKWNFGYAWFGAKLPIYQIAEYIGFSGLSMLTVLANVPLFWAWKARNNKTVRNKILWRFTVVFMGLNAFGLSTKAWQPTPDSSFNTLLVQANIGNSEKMAAEFGRGFYGKIIKQYQDVTDEGLREHKGKHIDFILWSETAFPGLLNTQFQETYYPQQLSQYIKNRQISLITGSYAKSAKTDLITNSMFVLNKQGEVQAPYYSKSILLVFGEYLPGEKYFPILRDLLPMVGNFGSGDGPTKLLTLNDYKIGPQICYESLFPEFSTALADLGAQFIVNVTNDSWYGTWQEPYQHMTMTLARAIEIRRPLVRVTNTGISTVVLASGEILEQSPMNQTWTGLYEVPYLSDPKATFYQRNFWLMPILLVGLLLLVLVSGLKSKVVRG